MINTTYEVGPRKVTEVYKNGNTTQRRDYTLDTVNGGTEAEFISAFRVYDVDSYNIKEASNGVVVEWKMLNGDEFTVSYN